MIVRTKKGTYQVGLERVNEYASRYAVVKMERTYFWFFTRWVEVHRICVTDWEVMTPWDRELTFTMACLDYEKQMASTDPAAGMQQPK